MSDILGDKGPHYVETWMVVGVVFRNSYGTLVHQNAQFQRL